MREYTTAYVAGSYYVLAKDPVDDFWWQYLEAPNVEAAQLTAEALRSAHLGDH